MRAINLNTSTYIDLLANDIPIGSTAVIQGANASTVVAADDSGGTGAATIATLTTAAPFQTCVLSNRWLKSTGGPVSILFN